MQIASVSKTIAVKNRREEPTVISGDYGVFQRGGGG